MSQSPEPKREDCDGLSLFPPHKKNMKKFIKENWLRITILIILVIILLLGSYYIYQKNRSDVFYKDLKCKDKSLTLHYNPESNKCEEEKKSELSNCSFELYDLKINRYHFEGPDENEIKRLEENCREGGMFKSLSCKYIEGEKKSNRRDTYFEIEGLIKVDSQEYLISIVSKIYTKGNKKILLGTGYQNIKRKVIAGESIPFKISVYINRNNQLINQNFNKDEEVDIDTYPWFLTCK